MSKVAFAFLVSFVCAGVSGSWAADASKDPKDPTGDKTEAHRRFNRALEMVDDGQIAEALIEFRRSYEIAPHFQVLYNIAQAHIALAQPVEAVFALERFLADGGTKVSKARRTEVEAELVRQRARIATLNVTMTPAEAQLQVDGKEIPAPNGALVLNVGVGNHTLSASADGYLPQEIRLTVAGEDRKDVRLDLEKVSPPSPPPPTLVTPPVAEPLPAAPVVVPSAPEATTSPNRLIRHISYALAAGGLVALGASGLLWMRAVDKHDQAQTKCQGFAVCPGEAEELQSQAKSATTWTNVTAVTGGLFVAGGVALYFLFPVDTPATHATVVPYFDRNMAGLTMRGGF